jgi:hypothetical protein
MFILRIWPLIIILNLVVVAWCIKRSKEALDKNQWTSRMKHLEQIVGLLDDLFPQLVKLLLLVLQLPLPLISLLLPLLKNGTVSIELFLPSEQLLLHFHEFVHLLQLLFNEQLLWKLDEASAGLLCGCTALELPYLLFQQFIVAL